MLCVCLRTGNRQMLQECACVCAFPCGNLAHTHTHTHTVRTHTCAVLTLALSNTHTHTHTHTHTQTQTHTHTRTHTRLPQAVAREVGSYLGVLLLLMCGFAAAFYTVFRDDQATEGAFNSLPVSFITMINYAVGGAYVGGCMSGWVGETLGSTGVRRWAGWHSVLGFPKRNGVGAFHLPYKTVQDVHERNAAGGRHGRQQCGGVATTREC